MCVSRLRTCSPLCPPPANLRQIARNSSALRPSLWPPSGSTPTGRNHAPARKLLCTTRLRRRCRGRIQGRPTLSPQYAPAAINLADLYRQLGRDGEGESVLRAAITASSGDAGLHYALGLTLTRLKRHTEALDELRQAAELDRQSARYAYVYGVALHSGGHIAEAMKVLKENLVRHPNDRNTLLALISYNRDAGDFRARSNMPNTWPRPRRVTAS